ncbi:MAG: glycyl-radical enzyme activating protein [Magnetococcus sp. YQC-5]
MSKNPGIVGHIFDVKRDSGEDGPGIRTTVFFKGCPLSCVWCQNPEGISVRPGLFFNARACRPERCQLACLSVCQTGCLQAGDPIRVEHPLCNRCDRCFSLCPEQALRPVGEQVSVETLVERIVIDKPFFLSSGGGVTLSGGEPTRQMRFLHHFVQALRAQGISIAMETCGLFDYDLFQKLVLPYLDLIYLDLKLLDDAESRRYTGRSNRRILNNFFRLIRQRSCPVKMRIPLIPGITDSPENLAGLGCFLRCHGVHNCSLLPYNPLGEEKYPELGITTLYRHHTFMQPEEIQRCVASLYSVV